MKNFKLDENGDVIIKNNDIAMISDNDLLLQTIKTILGTNKREWFLNLNEGINFGNILKKNPEKDIIRDEILSGLLQVDSSFYLTEFVYEIDDRNLTVKFTAKKADGTIISDVFSYAA